jgi:hypothetical protein
MHAPSPSKPTQQPGPTNSMVRGVSNVTGSGPTPEPDYVESPLFDTPIYLEPAQPNDGDTD